MFTYPRKAVKKYPPTLTFATKTRNIYTGIFEQAIAKTAKQIGAPIPSARTVRLQLASAVFEKTVTSFKELSDAEIWGLYQWVTVAKQEAYTSLVSWLTQEYGEQTNMFGEKQSDY